MKKFLLFGLFVLAFSMSYGQGKKRGIAYGHHSLQDLAALSPAVSWWYNWAVAPESAVADGYDETGFEFVPMCWNESFDETALRNFLANHPETKYLLAFNEPNFKDQASMTPSQAAAQWPRLEAIAKDFNLKIVAPAVNYCGNCVSENGTTYTDPFQYLDDFFAACPDCQVDYIAAHCYMNTVAALQWYISEYKKYHKPIWLTEFAGWESNGNINSLDDQMNFMIGAVDMLEADPDIFRYAWFTGRANGINNYPYIDLLGANGQLTSLGKIYKQMPIHDPDQVVDIPARIEAEAYNQMQGILIEKTTDKDGFANVGYIDADDWLEYKIKVPKTADFDLLLRVSSTKLSSLNILVNHVRVLTHTIPKTNGYENWSTTVNKLSLTSGLHTIRLQAANDGFNLNWFQIGQLTSSAENTLKNDEKFKVFPNPAHSRFVIQTSLNIKSLQLFNLMGQQLWSFPFSELVNLENLSSGIYVLKAIGLQGTVLQTKKVVII
ncbi:MAG TPA: glycosyl hydrolase [Sunxiuqinia sp.]|nr:glycosyl hydrolase [Sunxiuqinia sp.]